MKTLLSCSFQLQTLSASFSDMALVCSCCLLAVSSYCWILHSRGAPGATGDQLQGKATFPVTALTVGSRGGAWNSRGENRSCRSFFLVCLCFCPDRTLGCKFQVSKCHRTFSFWMFCMWWSKRILCCSHVFAAPLKPVYLNAVLGCEQVYWGRLNHSWWWILILKLLSVACCAASSEKLNLPVCPSASVCALLWCIKPNLFTSVGPFNDCNWLMTPKLHVPTQSGVAGVVLSLWGDLWCVDYCHFQCNKMCLITVRATNHEVCPLLLF